MNNKTIKTKIYLKNDKMFNNLILQLYNTKNYVQFESEPKDKQEELLYYMIEKEIGQLENSIQILKNKRTDDYYEEMN